MRYKTLLIGAAFCILVGAIWLLWSHMHSETLPADFASSNGRLEATEINIATKSAGRLAEVSVREGEYVKKGQVLARMDTAQLVANLRQAQAEQRRAEISIDTAHDLVTQREAERVAATAVVEQRQSQLSAASNTSRRARQLLNSSTVSQQVFDDANAAEQAARATLAAAEASAAASDAAINAAKALVVDAEAAVEAAKARVQSVETEIVDSTLIAPRNGRIQYLVAEPGEVLAAGGRVLNLLDLSNVYMTFFLPTAQAGKTPIGAEARLVLDAAPQMTIPATVSFVADVAQFTPKTVETEEERQKLAFRVRAQIPEELLKKYLRYVKTGLPGLAYVRLSPDAPWPDSLERNLVR